MGDDDDDDLDDVESGEELEETIESIEVEDGNYFIISSLNHKHFDRESSSFTQVCFHVQT